MLTHSIATMVRNAYAAHGSRWFDASSLPFVDQILMVDRDYLEIVGHHARLTREAISDMRQAWAD